MDDTISRRAAIDAIISLCDDCDSDYCGSCRVNFPGEKDARKALEDLPPAQPEPCEDAVSRQVAIDTLLKWMRPICINNTGEVVESDVMVAVRNILKTVPSVQPELHTCVNCGRTVNNGGWYADGGTRCPIEEHYALPKDGYCHLWEKRNVTDDDYPERREE